MKTPSEYAQVARNLGIVGAAEREYLASLITTIQREAIDAVAKLIEEDIEPSSDDPYEPYQKKLIERIRALKP